MTSINTIPANSYQLGGSDNRCGHDNSQRTPSNELIKPIEDALRKLRSKTYVDGLSDRFKACLNVGTEFITMNCETVPACDGRLAQLQNDVSSKRLPGMPGIVGIPLEVYEDLALDCIQTWFETVLEFFNTTVGEISAELQDPLKECMGLEDSVVYKSVEDIIADYIRGRGEKMLVGLQLDCEEESRAMVVFNDPEFHHRKALIMEYRHNMRSRDCATHVELGPDPYSEAPEVASYVQAYHQVAAERLKNKYKQKVISRLIPKPDEAQGLCSLISNCLRTTKTDQN